MPDDGQSPKGQLFCYTQTPEPSRIYSINNQQKREILQNSTHMRPCTYAHKQYKGQRPKNESTIKIEATIEESNYKIKY
jgi:hypothetical protein